MKDKVLNLLQINKDEVKKVLVLILQSLFIGVFVSYYNTFINAAFLDTFRISFLAYGYLASGLIGLATSFVFSLIIKRLAFKVYSVLVLLIIFICVCILKLTIDQVPSVLNASFSLFNANFSFNKLIIFIGFIVYSPFSLIVILIYTSQLIKLFTLRQGKRLFSLIGSGSVIAAIISYLSVPILLNYLSAPSDLLWISLCGLFLTAILQLFINKSFFLIDKRTLNKLKPIKVVSDKLKEEKTYIRNIYLLSIISMIGLILVSFLFLSETKLFFRDFDVKVIGQFLGLFFGLSKGIELIVNTFFSGRLLAKHGIRFGLESLPKLLLPLTTIAIITSILSFTYNSFNTVTFIVIVLCMMTLIVVKRSLEDVTFKNLFQPLDKSIKHIIQSNAEIKARQIGIVIVAIILIIIQQSEYKDLNKIKYLVALFLACILWLFLIRKTLVSLKNYIRNVFDTHININLFKREKERIEFKTLELKAKLFKLFFPSLSIDKKTKEISLIDNDYIIKQHQNKVQYINYVKNHWSNKFYPELLRIIKYENIFIVSYLISSLSDKINSNNFKDYIIKNEKDINSRLLIILLNINFDIKHHVEKNKILLKESSEDVLLEAMFYLKVLKYIDVEIPIENFNFEKNVKTRNLESLYLENPYKKNLKITQNEYLKLKDRLDYSVQYYTWILASIVDLNTNPADFNSIIKSLTDELHNEKQNLFNLVKPIYGKDEINKILYFLDNNTEDNKILAVEMIDMVFNNELKEYFVPIAEKNSIEDQLKKLREIFPQVDLNPIDRLKRIINYTPQKLNDWIRIQAIELLSKNLKVSGMPIELEANTYNSNLLIREATMICMFKINGETYQKPNSNIINVFERFKALRNSTIFSEIDTHTLVDILKITELKIFNFNSLNSLEYNNHLILLKGNTNLQCENLVDDLIIPNKEIIDTLLKKSTQDLKFLKIKREEFLKIAFCNQILSKKLSYLIIK
ncbi:MFS transporter [Psychroflexus planctonicus]|uniref:ADP,ATP carrier protein n=1 Tax=Psychroflexus planctonicus TaxID=1526575 RepID=A0ABQ1SLB5_9FLAO|nr:MFS transporter [Psychroflexus planctonicus]GGE41096.1 hypothetical protein GCM10010832_21440 [Psychroflexus planctonicus]